METVLPVVLLIVLPAEPTKEPVVIVIQNFTWPHLPVVHVQQIVLSVLLSQSVLPVKPNML